MNTKFTLKETSPKDKAFFDSYRPIIPSLHIIGKVAQVISAITEGITVWNITQSELSNLEKKVAIAISVFAILLVVAILELGGRKFLEVATRSLIWKRFSNIWYISLFVIVTAITISITILSFQLSTNGVKASFTDTVAEQGKFDLNEFKAERNQKLALCEKTFTEERKILDDAHQRSLKSSNQKFSSRMDAYKVKVLYHADLDSKGIKWAKSHVDEGKMIIANLRIEKAKQADNLEKEFTSKLNDWNTRRGDALALVEDQFQVEKKIAMKEFSQMQSSKSERAHLWGGIFAGLVGFSVILAFFCIVTVEIFRRGSGIEITYEETQVEASTFRLLLIGIKSRLENLFRSPAEKFAKSVTVKEKRKIGYTPATITPFSENSITAVSQNK